ncbi:hypothetical protein [Stenotrophomonas sp.]|uniref:hypothetical protein n=1 Tax=Stenotrophomonas sp. TaxID=69392 RepID=UPI0028A9207C|nr:hypothetical protein [Stenotrophomonas sp.]
MATKKSPPKKTPDRKTEALSIRIDPRSRYGLELLARIQRRSTTGVVEWVLQEAFKSEVFDNSDMNRSALHLDEALDSLWQLNEVERLVALAIAKPQLLTFEESRIWKVLKDTAAFWKTQQYPDFGAFRWPELLPQWEKIAPLLSEAVERNIVRGLTDAELSAAGVTLVSQQRPVRRLQIPSPTRAVVPDDFADDSDIPF